MKSKALQKKTKNRKHTIRSKITKLLIGMVISSVSLSAVISLWGLLSMKQLSTESSHRLGYTAAEDAKQALEDAAVLNLQTVAEERSLYIEEQFDEVAAYVHGIAAAAKNIYEYSEQYPDRATDLPEKGSNTLAAQRLWSEELAEKSSGGSLDPNFIPPLTEEILKLGNIQDMLVQYNAHNDMVSSVYIATKSGWVIQADDIAANKYTDDSEAPGYFDAAERQWFQRAACAEEGQVVYSDVLSDIHEGGNCIVCAEPVFLEDELVAVAGVGSYLDMVNEAVLNTVIGETGYAFLLGSNGEILVSPKAEGETAAAVERNTDIRTGKNAELAAIAEDLLLGYSGVEQITLDNKEVYLAYAPLENLGWGVMIVMDVDEVVSLAEESFSRILLLTQEVSESQDRIIREILISLATVMGAALLFICLAGTDFSRKLTEPICILTNKVAQMNGGNLDANIRIETGDEVEELANAFAKMAAQLKEYIGNFAAAAAEKERIRTELSLASAIQADMLPGSGHVLWTQEEISLYASMTPAKEVGGDFYDFFRVDHNHLVFLIADVSGKGVPASLFMVVAKTLLQSRITGGSTLAEAVAEVNERLCAGNKNGMFVTAWIGVLELSTGTLTYVNAGHNPPLLGNPENGFVFLRERSGFVLAGMEDMIYEQREARLSPGDILFLYTDGITEANDVFGNLYGENRLLEALGSRTESSPRQIAEAVWEDVQTFQGEAEQFDDITMFVLRYRERGGDSIVCDMVKNGQNRNTGPANLLRLKEVQDFVEGTFEQAGVPVKEIRKFLIALDEIFSNICRYGGANEIIVECNEEVNEVQLIIEDDGKAFNPLARGDPDTKAPVESRKAGGLGIYMVRRMMDEVIYEFIGGRNRLTMILQNI